MNIDKKDIDLLKASLRINGKVITSNGLSKIKAIFEDSILVEDDKLYSFFDVLPVMKGFKHLGFKEIYDIADIITENKSFNNYKLNLNFLPHFFEVTEESKDVKIQIYHNFDIIYCDRLSQNLGQVYFYLISKGYDIHNLYKKGIVVIDSDKYARY